MRFGAYVARGIDDRDFTTRHVEPFERLIAGIPEVAHSFVIVGSRAVTELISFWQLKSWEDRTFPGLMTASNTT